MSQCVPNTTCHDHGDGLSVHCPHGRHGTWVVAECMVDQYRQAAQFIGLLGFNSSDEFSTFCPEKDAYRRNLLGHSHELSGKTHWILLQFGIQVCIVAKMLGGHCHS